MSDFAPAKPHKRLLAWQRSMTLFVEIHRVSAKWPWAEQYLCAQIRRAALSAPSNIAEGAADLSRDQFRSFLGYAIRSLNEVDTQVEAALRIGILAEEEGKRLATMTDECIRLTYGLRRSLHSKAGEK